MIVDFEFANMEPSVRKVSWGSGSGEMLAITLGPGSYIVSGSFEHGSLDCHLLVGRYSSIGHRAKFLLALNHDICQVTTYPFENLVHADNNCGMNQYFSANHYQIIIGNDVYIGYHYGGRENRKWSSYRCWFSGDEGRSCLCCGSR